MAPAASFTVALSCTVSPTCFDAVVGDTSTDATTTAGSDVPPPQALINAPMNNAVEISRALRAAAIHRIVVVSFAVNTD